MATDPQSWGTDAVPAQPAREEDPLALICLSCSEAENQVRSWRKYYVTCSSAESPGNQELPFWRSPRAKTISKFNRSLRRFDRNLNFGHERSSRFLQPVPDSMSGVNIVPVHGQAWPFRDGPRAWGQEGRRAGSESTISSSQVCTPGTPVWQQWHVLDLTEALWWRCDRIAPLWRLPDCHPGRYPFGR